MPDDTTSDRLTAADLGLPVLDTEGNQIGVLAAVGDDDVEVDPDPDVTDDARASLGWDASENVQWTVPVAAVEYVSGEDVLATFPKAAIDHDAGDGAPDDVLRVDLDALNSRA